MLKIIHKFGKRFVTIPIPILIEDTGIDYSSEMTMNLEHILGFIKIKSGKVMLSLTYGDRILPILYMMISLLISLIFKIIHKILRSL